MMSLGRLCKGTVESHHRHIPSLAPMAIIDLVPHASSTNPHHRGPTDAGIASSADRVGGGVAAEQPVLLPRARGDADQVGGRYARCVSFKTRKDGSI
jgi:hypothetical protein